MKKIHVLGAGTISPVASHLALCAPAWGTTARNLSQMLEEGFHDKLDGWKFINAKARGYEVVRTLTRMGDPSSSLITNKGQASETRTGDVPSMA